MNVFHIRNRLWAKKLIFLTTAAPPGAGFSMGMLYAVFGLTLHVCPSLPQIEVISRSLRVVFLDRSGDLADSPCRHDRTAFAREGCGMSDLYL